MSNVNDDFFSRIENKTRVNKDSIVSLAKKLQNGNFKDKNLLSEVIDEISVLTNKEVSEEQKEKIINTIIEDRVPDNLEKYI